MPRACIGSPTGHRESCPPVCSSSPLCRTALRMYLTAGWSAGVQCGCYVVVASVDEPVLKAVCRLLCLSSGLGGGLGRLLNTCCQAYGLGGSSLCAEALSSAAVNKSTSSFVCITRPSNLTSLLARFVELES